MATASKGNSYKKMQSTFQRMYRETKNWIKNNKRNAIIIGLIMLIEIVLIILLPILYHNSNNGKISLDQGKYWKGQKKNGKPHGEGEVFDAVNNRIYKGNCKYGFYDGKGIEYYVNGKKKYDGVWIMGKKQKGTFYDSNEIALYEGECRNEIYEGYGKELYSSGKIRYEGLFVSGLKTDGSFYSESGMKTYEGACINDIYNGFGELYSDSSIVYSGNFVNGMRDGRGISYHNSTIAAFVGIWNKNEMRYGMLYDVSGNLIIKGSIPNTVLYVLDEHDLQLMNDNTVELIVGVNGLPSTTYLEISGYANLKLIRFMEYSGASLNAISIQNNPKLESIGGHANSCTHYPSYMVNEFMEDAISIVQARRKLIVANNPSLRIFEAITYAFSDFTLFEFTNLPSLKTLYLGTASDSSLLEDLSLFGYFSFNFVLDDLPSLETIEIGCYALVYADTVFSNLPKLTSIIVGASVGKYSISSVVNNTQSLNSYVLYRSAYGEAEDVTLKDIPSVKTVEGNAGVYSLLRTIKRGANVAEGLIQKFKTWSPSAVVVNV